MTTRTRTEVTCDGCEAVGAPHDWDETAAWMAAHGWEQQQHRDLCPTCLMDDDAATRDAADRGRAAVGAAVNAAPDPQTVREIARDCAADYLGDARDIAAHVMGHFGTGVPGDVYAWTDAVRADLHAAAVSWPDEQPATEQDGDTRAVKALLDAQTGGASMAECKQAFNDVRHRFADRIAALDARDADGSAS